MRNIKKLFLCLLMLFSITGITLTLTSCEKIDEQYLLDLPFEDLTVDYDGNTHSIYVENIPEDALVTYANNEKVNPGVYEVTCTILYEGIMVKKTATLTINKLESVLEAEAEQVAYLYGNNIKVNYKVNNREQRVTIITKKDGQVVDNNAIYNEGVYDIEIYAKESTKYAESNHVNVKLTVYDSKFDVEFNDTEVVYDGTEKSVELTGTLPSGYTVKYKDNTGTEAGYYYSLAYIKDASGNVVETHAATLNIEYAENEEFAEFLDEFFVAYLEGDQLSVNIFCENPEDFGLGRYEASWYTYESYEDTDLDEAKKEIANLRTELEVYKDAQLSNLQQVAYNNIESFLDYYTDYYNIEDSNYMKILYVDQFGGYVADFGTYMEAYSLRCKEDVQDVVDYITSTSVAFPSYLSFVKDKTDKGYALSNFTITEMRNYLKELMDDGEDYYLKAILSFKIDNLDFLTAEEKTSFKNQIADAIKNHFVPGVTELYNGLEAYLDKLPAENEGYWSVYENGKEMYVLELMDLLGLNEFDEEDYIEDIEDAFSNANQKVISSQQKLVKNHNISTYADLEALITKYPIYNKLPIEMMDYLDEFAKTIVPELKNKPEITIKNMDAASAKVSNAVAYYMKSALDSSQSEFITLNPQKLGDSNDVLGTLAHEGYPGHLYAYAYSKEQGLSNLSTIMTSTAHGEGWATYVELKLYEYAKANSDDQTFKDIMDYLYAQQLSGFLLETRIDAGIHLEGWTVSNVQNFLKRNGYNSDLETATEIYDLIIEMPSGYAAYGYGKLFFVNLHEEAKDILGGYYDEIEFNAMLLSKGWTSLGELENTYNDYMKAKCHKYGITFEAN